MGYNGLQSRFAATVMTMTVLAIIVLSLRVYVRSLVVRNFGKDDVVITIAMVCKTVSMDYRGLG